MAKSLITLVFLLLAPVSAKAQTDTLVIMSYNVENFFHPDDDPDKNDDAFTPDGSNHWTNYRMRQKAAKISRVITSVNGWDCPQIIGLCEVEGPKAVEALLYEGGLSDDALNYKAICYPTPDARGIAPALLYDADIVKIISSYPISMSVPDSNFITRDVIYAKIKYATDTFHIFVNHWPSKYGGEAETVWKREHVARHTRSVCDSITATNPDAKIVLIGDFNDVASSDALAKVFGATRNGPDYINLSTFTNRHSYKYHGEWSTIDHIIVSKSICSPERPWFFIGELNYLVEPDSRYVGYKPFRTYIGQRYNGGYSDHLPVFIKIPIYKK